MYIRVTASNCAGSEPCIKVAADNGPSDQETETTERTHVYGRNEDGGWMTVDLSFYGRSAANDSSDALSQHIWAKGKFISPTGAPSPDSGYGT